MKDATHISMLLDRSGSMGSIKTDVIGGFNAFLSDQKAVKGDCYLTLTQFDSEGIDVVHEHAELSTVPELTKDTYQPRGGTPLLDALGKTIEATGRALENITEQDRPDKVIFVVITDGEENASHTYTKERIKAMIGEQERLYNWNFVFLGANQDAFAEAGAVGIAMAAAANFTPDSAGVRHAYAAMSANTVRYRGSGQSADLNWTVGQRAAMSGEDDTDQFNFTGTATRKHRGPQPPKRTRLNWKRK